MKLTIFTEAGSFLEKVRPILERNEAANSLILSNLLRLAGNPTASKTPSYMALVEDGEEVTLVAYMSPPFKLVLYAEKADLGDSLSLLAENLAGNSWEVSGVLGPEKLTTGFALLWIARKGGTYRQGVRQGIYELTEVIQPKNVAGKFRPAQETDVALLAGWANAFHQEALGSPFHGDILETTRLRVASGGLFVWENETGQVVTMAGRARPTWNGETVNAVYTPPEYRGKGYASACVAALSQLSLDSGKRFTTLFTDLSNLTSNRIYQNIGYNHLLDYDELDFEL